MKETKLFWTGSDRHNSYQFPISIPSISEDDSKELKYTLHYTKSTDTTEPLTNNLAGIRAPSPNVKTPACTINPISNRERRDDPFQFRIFTQTRPVASVPQITERAPSFNIYKSSLVTDLKEVADNTERTPQSLFCIDVVY